MSTQYPQILEGSLDAILAGTITDVETLKNTFRSLLLVRRRYSDPTQDAASGDSLAGLSFSNRWTVASQKARVEQGIAYLAPIVGAAVGDYPPPSTYWAGFGAGRIDAAGNYVAPGKP